MSLVMKRPILAALVALNVALGLVPLWENCFGKDWQQVMTRERALELFRRM